MDQGGAPQVEQYLARLEGGEIARIISRIPSDEQQRLFKLLSQETAAELIEILPSVQMGEILQELDPQRVANILVKMPSNARADVLNSMDGERVEAILNKMVPEAAKESRQLAQYPPDVAGGLMITEYLAYPQNSKVGQVVDDMRKHSAAYSDYDVQYTYVTEPNGLLVGVLRLRDLLLAAGDRAISRIMIREPMTVRDTDRLRTLGDFFDTKTSF